MPAVATTMTAMGDMTFASTADWPTISAPMTLTVSPMGLGSRSPASCSSSKAMSMPVISSAVENGTSCLDWMIESSSFEGIISW